MAWDSWDCPCSGSSDIRSRAFADLDVLALILVVVVAIVILLRISKDSVDIVDEIHADALRQRSGQLGFDIYTFLDDRDGARTEAPEYDAETVRQYHLRFGPQLLQIAKQAEDMGALDGAVQPLRDKQGTLKEIRQLAGYLKSGIATKSQL
jgi:hypothetical protein